MSMHCFSSCLISLSALVFQGWRMCAILPQDTTTISCLHTHSCSVQSSVSDVFCICADQQVWWCAGSQAEGLQIWRQTWIPVLLAGLRSPDSHLRHRVSLYAVPVPLGLDQASALPLLQQVLQPQPGHCAVTDAQVMNITLISDEREVSTRELAVL